MSLDGFATFQLIGGEGGYATTILYFLLFFAFIFFYPRLMVLQVMVNLERTANTLEEYSRKGKSIVVKKISTKPDKSLREKISNFMEFFAIEPVSLDPYGVMKKIEHIGDLSERRFNYFVKKTAPKMNAEDQANLVMGLSGAVSLHQISKIVRHFVELVRKTKNMQIAMIVQMQLPMIERMSKALLKGTEALANGWAIGDSIGPYIASRMAGPSKFRDAGDDVIVAQRRIKGKQVLVVRARGPGGRLGKLGKTINKLSRRGKIAKVITIDAAAKLEGEKTGSVAEGIGVAIGGIGVDRSYIEELATKGVIPLDTYVVKMSQEEAIMPMRAEILDASESVVKRVEENIAETREKGSIVVIGVGNCSGIGNSEKEARSADAKIRKIAKMMKEKEEEEEKANRSFFRRLFPMQYASIGFSRLFGV